MSKPNRSLLGKIAKSIGAGVAGAAVSAVASYFADPVHVVELVRAVGLPSGVATIIAYLMQSPRDPE